MQKTARQACASVVLLWCLVVVPACGARIDPNATPQQQAQAELRDIQRSALIVERVGDLVKSLQDTEILLANAGRVPSDTHVAIQTYLKLSAEYVLSELESAKDDAKSPLERRHGIMRALKFIGGLQKNVIEKIPDASARTELGMIAMAISTLLLTMQLVA